MKTVPFYTLHDYLSSFDTDEDIPILPPDERLYDDDNEDGVDIRTDPRLDIFDIHEILDGVSSTSLNEFTPHIDMTKDKSDNVSPAE